MNNAFTVFALLLWAAAAALLIWLPRIWRRGGAPETNEDWLSVFLKLNVTGLIENVFSNAQLKNCSGEDFYFRLDENAMTIYNDDMLPKLSSTLSSYLNRKAIVHILSEQVDGETPSKLSARLKQEARQKMLDGFQQNSNVQKIINHFSGEISISSITTIDE